MPAITITDGRLRRRRDRIEDYLDVWGDLRISDFGARTDRRLIQFELHAPGEGLPTEVQARYGEYYRRDSPTGWVLVKYHYEYLDLVRGHRFAYHLHDIGVRRSVPHAHCEPATESLLREDVHHLRAIEIDLREAHEIFMQLYAAQRTQDCDDFLPLDLPRA